MAEYDTGVKCPVCKEKNIIAEIQRMTKESPLNIPDGPGAEDFFYIGVVNFHCPDCQVLFNHPPGKPGCASELIKKAESDFRK